jgi:hypothetical protein
MDVYIDDYTVVGTVAFRRRTQGGRMASGGTTVRIRKETWETLRELEAHTGKRTPDLLARAVDQFYRSLLIAETNRGYAELRAQEGSAEELDRLEGSLADGLD